MLKNNAFYNSSFRFRNIDFNNVNDIYFAINIIVIIATTLFETLIIVIFIFELIIVIVFNVDIIIIIVIVIVIIFFVIVFERFILKLIAFDFNIKSCFAMSASFDKS